MLQITTDITTLTVAQREAVAGFILSFPAAFVVDEPEVEGVEDEEEPSVGITPEEAFATVVASAPGVLTIPAPPVATDDKYDKDGLPWDERIHASSHAKVADGTWRAKRGVDPALFVQVEAELKALMAIPKPAEAVETGSFGVLSSNFGEPIAIPAPPAVLGVTEIPSSTLYAIPPPPALTVVPQAKHCDSHDVWYVDANGCPKCPLPVAAPVVAPPPPAAPVADFMGLLTRASALVQAKKLSIEEVNEIVQNTGVPSLPLLQNRPDLVPQVQAAIDLIVASR